MDTSPYGLQIIPLFIVALYCSLIASADAALRGLKLNKLKRDADAGDAQAKRLYLLSVKDEPHTLKIAKAFLEIVIVLMFARILTARSGPLLALFPLEVGNIVFPFLLVLRVLVFGVLYILVLRLLPKRIARSDAEKTLKYLFPLANITSRIFFPLALFITFLERTLANLLHIRLPNAQSRVTEDEIRMMVGEGEEKGAIEESERDMIENVFEFNNLTAADCMTHRTDMAAVWIEDDEESILQTIGETGLSRFPVYGDDLDHILGIVTTRDYLMNRTLKNPRPLAKLVRPARFVPETVRTDALFKQMQQGKYHMAIVVDEYGGTSGLITMEDLLEQIVGNIYDEYDPQTQQEIIQKTENVWRVEGSVEIETFNEATGNNLPIDEEFETIGGYILSHLGYIPEEGAQPSFENDGLLFKVELVKDRRIEWVEVTRLPSAVQQEKE